MAGKQEAKRSGGKAERKCHLAKFTHLYESRDKRLCVFEDEHGHLTSVRASRLA